MKSAADDLRSLLTGGDNSDLRKGGPYIGVRGGLWADPDHKNPWHETLFVRGRGSVSGEAYQAYSASHDAAISGEGHGKAIERHTKAMLAEKKRGGKRGEVRSGHHKQWILSPHSGGEARERATETASGDACKGRRRNELSSR